MSELLLFPCNGNAVEALDCVADDVHVVGFVDDDPRKIGTRMLGIPVFDRAAFSSNPGARILAVPGSPVSFRRRAETITGLGVPRDRFAVVVHPAASVSPRARLGANVLLMAGVVVTATATLEDHVVVLPNAVIHHDSRVRTYTLIGSGAVVAGAVDVGVGCYIGSGARIRNGLSIAPLTLIGMGATVVHSISEARGVWVGTPARMQAGAGIDETPPDDATSSAGRGAP